MFLFTPLRQPTFGSQIITIENDCEQQIQQHILREAYVMTRNKAIFILLTKLIM